MSNPIISGYYADPDIRYFEGRYYIYPTTDGNKWHGASFKCFLQIILKDWTDHGEIFEFFASVMGKKGRRFYVGTRLCL